MSDNNTQTDRAAIERARELFAAHIKKGCVVAPDFVEHIADAIAAAVAEARAAERNRCEQIAQNYIDRPTSGPKNNTLSAFEQGMDHMAGCVDNASAILRAIRALTPPAQSETPK